MSMNQPMFDPGAAPLIEAVLGAVPPVVLPRPDRGAKDQIDAWNEVQARIAAWTPTASEPDVRYDEDGYRLPSGKAVAIALQIATRLREGGVGVPSWLVQDGNGGIDFEWKSANRTETLNVDSSGEAELKQFEDSRLH